jgi:hypothetical protein
VTTRYQFFTKQRWPPDQAGLKFRDETDIDTNPLSLYRPFRASGKPANKARAHCACSLRMRCHAQLTAADRAPG